MVHHRHRLNHQSIILHRQKCTPNTVSRQNSISFQNHHSLYTVWSPLKAISVWKPSISIPINCLVLHLRFWIRLMHDPNALHLGPPQAPHNIYGPPKQQFSVPKPQYGLPIKAPVNFRPQQTYGPPLQQFPGPIRQPLSGYGPPPPSGPPLGALSGPPSFPNIQKVNWLAIAGKNGETQVRYDRHSHWD